MGENRIAYCGCKSRRAARKLLDAESDASNRSNTLSTKATVSESGPEGFKDSYPNSPSLESEHVVGVVPSGRAPRPLSDLTENCLHIVLS